MKWFLLVILFCQPVFAGRNDLVSLEATVLSVNGSTIALSNVNGLAVGDSLIIESQHGYNEAGLDGVWPISNLPVGSGYYTGASRVGRSYIATIKELTGNKAVMSRPVPPAAKWLTCYRDNSDAIKYAIEKRIQWPDGQRFAYATSTTQPVLIYLTDEWFDYDFRGCEIFAPRGCGALQIGFGRVGGGAFSNKRFRNLVLRGNARDSGYGFIVPSGTWIQGSSMPSAWLVGGVSASPMSNVIIENFTCIDNWRAVGLTYASDCLVKNCRSEFTDVLRQYVQWEYLAAHCKRCRFEDVTVVDPNGMRAAFSAFRCEDVQFVKCGGENIGFESNTSNGTLFEDCWTDITVENPHDAWSFYNSLISINTNIANQQGNDPSSSGIMVKNFAVRYNVIPYPERNKIWNTVIIGQGIGAAIDGLRIEMPPGSRMVTTAHHPAGLVASNSLFSTAVRVSGHPAVISPIYTVKYVPQSID